MKWNASMAKNAEEWVSKYGLLEYGAQLKDFLTSMGISKDTYYRWIDETATTYKREFCEAIKRGQEAYKAKLILTAESSLINLVEGAETMDERTEYVSDAKGNPVIAKKIVTKHKESPNVAAVIFALTNLKPEQWKNKQNADITTNGKDIVDKQLTTEQAKQILKELDSTL